MGNDDCSTNHGRFEASVNIFVDSSRKAQVLDVLSKLENIEEIYDVAGEFDIVSIISASARARVPRHLAEENHEDQGRQKHHNLSHPQGP